MENIMIPDFDTPKIYECILSLFKKYDSINNNITNYKNDKKNEIYICDTFMKFLLESLNIKLKDFEYLFRKYVDPEHEDFECKDNDEGWDDGTMAEYNFSKIITLYIYKKFVIYDNKNKFIDNIMFIFNDLKNKLHHKIANISIENVNEIVEDMEEYKNTLKLIKYLTLYVEKDDIEYFNNINLELDFKLDNNILKELLLIFNCISKFVENITEDIFNSISFYFDRNHDDIIYNPIISYDQKIEYIKNDENILNNDRLKLVHVDQNKNENINFEEIVNNIEIKENINIVPNIIREEIIDENNTSKIVNNSNTKEKRKPKKETNQDDEINIVLNKIKKHYKKIYNNEDIYNQLIIENRQIIKTFSIIHQKYIKNEIDDNFINNIYKLYDSNKARFLKNIEIFDNIYKEENLYNCNYLFLKFTFNKINKESINNLINTLKSEILKK